MKSQVTLKDIALKVGVAEMTVSSALRNVGRVGAETRKKIIAAADELGYRPNLAARSIRSGRFGCLALLTSQNHPTPVSLQMLGGIETIMNKNNLHLILSQLADKKVTDNSYMPQILRESMADGLLIKHDIYIPDEMKNILAQHHFKIPAIWINSKHESDCIYPDELDSGRRATEHLINLGHKNIWYLTYCIDKDSHYSISDRFNGYKQAMESAELQPNWLGKGKKELSRSTRLSLIQELFESDNCPTAIVTTNTTTAGIALLAAAKLNIKVPEELSIITFSNEPVDSSGILLDTMKIPEGEMGKQAVEMLLEKINDHSIIQKPYIAKYSLEAGDSCAPPPTQI
jgi:DNA-binding LacI/PurR family transcriptional regulator